MKAACFQKPLEFNLRIDGEIWRQGDPIKGELKVRNHGSTPVNATKAKVVLAIGALKQVHAKLPDAFEVLHSLHGADGEIPPGGEWSLNWEFPTDRNCQITDTGASLFMLYGAPEDPSSTAQLGQIQLIFQPFLYVDEIMKSLQTQHRFIRKSQKSRKGRVDFKLEPPSSKAFASLEQLVISAKCAGDDIELLYQFHVKKLEALPGRTEFTKQKKEYLQNFGQIDYLTTSGKFNHESVEALIQRALAEADPKIGF